MFQSVMIAGGIVDGKNPSDSVVEYDIEANTYNTIQPLPDPLRHSTLVNTNGYMYNFGGVADGDFKSVNRIALTLTNDWEKLDDMVTADKDMIVIPYNN